MDPREQQAQELIAKADDLRPPVQALMDFVVQGAKTGITLGGTPDEIWAATVINAADGMKLDPDDRGQLVNACVVAELVLKLAGIED